MKTQDIYVAVGFDNDGDSRAIELDPTLYPRPTVDAGSYLCTEHGDGPYKQARWVCLTLPDPSETAHTVTVYDVEVLD